MSPNRQNINPAMITLARESRGWTQKILAAALGISQAAVCKYEIGSLQVPEHEVRAIARVLRFDISFFAQNDPVISIGSSVIFHRRRTRVPNKVLSRVQAEVNIRRMQVTRLLRGLNTSREHAFPSIPPGSFDGNVEHVAREVRKVWGLPKGPIPDLTQLVEAAGGIVIQMDFGTPQIDGTHVWAPQLPPVFYMNCNVPGERYRFSLAHEVGHAIMHHASALNEVEEEAYRFGSEFLMPRAQIRSDLRNLDLESAARLKQVWKVSMQALIMRAERLGQISSAKKRRLFTQLSARNQRINEPWPLPLEEARVQDEMIAFHRENLELGEDDMRKILFAEQLGPLEPLTERKPRLRLAEDLSLFE